MDLIKENMVAVDLWNKIQAVGPELAWRMTDLRLTAVEAGNLLEKLVLISSVIRRWEAEKVKEK